MTRAALDIVLNDPERYVMTEEERSQYERLAVFFGTAAVDPSRFPLSPRQASRIKSVVKKAKGPSQPKSLRNKRKARQERRIGYAKKRREQNRYYREQYNEAMAKLRAEEIEMEEAYQEAQERLAKEAKFDVFDGVGNLIMSGIPESAIKPMTEGQTLPSETRKVILPGTAEALGLE